MAAAANSNAEALTQGFIGCGLHFFRVLQI
jgi:hypothetical protein